MAHLGKIWCPVRPLSKLPASLSIGCGSSKKCVIYNRVSKCKGLNHYWGTHWIVITAIIELSFFAEDCFPIAQIFDNLLVTIFQLKSTLQVYYNLFGTPSESTANLTFFVEQHWENEFSNELRDLNIHIMSYQLLQLKLWIQKHLSLKVRLQLNLPTVICCLFPGPSYCKHVWIGGEAPLIIVILEHTSLVQVVSKIYGWSRCSNDWMISFLF